MPNKAPSVEKVNIRRLWPRTLVWTRRQEGWPSRSEALGPASNDARRFLDPAINIHAVVFRRMLRGSAQAWSRLPWPQHADPHQSIHRAESANPPLPMVRRYSDFGSSRPHREAWPRGRSAQNPKPDASQAPTRGSKHEVTGGYPSGALPPPKSPPVPFAGIPIPDVLTFCGHQGPTTISHYKRG